MDLEEIRAIEDTSNKINFHSKQDVGKHFCLFNREGIGVVMWRWNVST